jgi:CRISPR-associated protein Cas5t
MKALRLQLFQETACYKKPLAFKVGETYPLPPYSTVKGMLHALIDAKEFIPMRLSIQGSYDTILVDYQTHYFFKKADSNEIPLVLDGFAGQHSFTEMTKMPLYIHMLYNVHLLIHLEAEDQVLEKIINAIENRDNYVSLGRWEDLVRFDEYKIVSVSKLMGEEELKYNAYVPVSLIPEEKRYIPYRLNWKYQIKSGVRKWEKINVGYLHAGQSFNANDLVDNFDRYLVDEDNNLIFYHIDKEQN